MAKYRKKPVVIDAVQYDGYNALEIVAFVGTNCLVSRRMEAPILIDTLEGQMRAEVGDWIIQGVNGEFYPCKDEIFRITYESVE